MFKWSPPKTRKGHTYRVLKPISQLGRVISLCLAGTLTKVLGFTKYPRHMGRNVANALNLRVKLLRVNKTEKWISLSLLQPFVSWTVGVPLDKLSELHGNVFQEKCEKCGKLYDRSFYVMDDDASLYFEGNTNIATFRRRSGECNVFSRVCLSFCLSTEGRGVPVEGLRPGAPPPVCSNVFNWNLAVPPPFLP